MPERNQIFVSYSHKDRKLFEEFKAMLAPAIRKGRLDLWSDTRIPTGAKWKEEIQRALDSASVAVFLLSPNFLASAFIAEHELRPLLKAAEQSGITVFLVHLSSSLYEEADLGEYQAAHNVSAPLDTLTKSERQSVLKSIAEKLIQAQSQALTRADHAGVAFQASPRDMDQEDYLKCCLLVWQAVETGFHASHGGGPTTTLHRKLDLASKWLKQSIELLPRISSEMPPNLLEDITQAKETLRSLITQARVLLPQPGETGTPKDSEYYKEAQDATYYLMKRMQVELRQDDDLSKLLESSERWPILGFQDEAQYQDYLYPSIKTLAKSSDSMQRDLLQSVLGVPRFSIGKLRAQGYTPAIVMDSLNALLTETWARWVDSPPDEGTELELTEVGSRLLKQLIG